MPHEIGYRWLMNHYGLHVTQALHAETGIGPTRAMVSDGMTERGTVQELLRPQPTFAGHLGFALKHEGIHLETLSRLFVAASAADVETWIRCEPTGQYARRTGFLYEKLTGRTLDVPDATRGNYVPAIDPELELTVATPANNARWRVRDNLLGTAAFSPQVLLTADAKRALTFNVRERITRLEGQFSADLVLRSAAIKESRASFASEHEEDKRDRIQRFAAVIEQRTGQSADPLSPAQLASLQRDILGPDALHYGFRRSPVFVCESARVAEERVHYIGPHWDDVPTMLAGLRELMSRTAGHSPVARAALVSFGLFYLHPIIDGNGRISRFLINDVLRRDGALPAPYIVPISVTLQKPHLRPLSYDGALELFSRPLMQQYRSHSSFVAEQHGDDEVAYNLQFDGYPDALHAWRYPDLTRHVTFLADALDLTVEQDMRAEAQYLQQHAAARARLKNIIEGPDPALDRIIRAVREARGTVSGKLRGEYPILDRPEIADDVVRAINEEFPWSAAS